MSPSDSGALGHSPGWPSGHLQALSLAGKEALGRWVTAMEAGRQAGRRQEGTGLAANPAPGHRLGAGPGREGRRALVPTGVESSQRWRPPSAG